MPRYENGCIKFQELILRIVEDVANGVMAMEAEKMREAIGNDRNGYRGRRLETCVGSSAYVRPSSGAAGSSRRTSSSAARGSTGRVFRQEDLSKKSIVN